MLMKYKPSAFLLLYICTVLSSSQTFAQNQENSLPPDLPQKLTLVQAVMCEGIKELIPQNEAIVFSLARGEVYCFTFFDPVPERTFIHHTWFFRDERRRKVKLTLKIPNYKTQSKIQLREEDKGPWRVEVSDEEGNILHILRFSITN